MANLVSRSWTCEKKETLLIHDFSFSENAANPLKSTVSCEAKVTRLDENSIVVVIRDISERFQLFEAEKKLVAESTARLKDAEANRFTRHEVKNGLLAAIGLCESLRETIGSKELSNTFSNILNGSQ
eukprot:CAMPEP_0197842922 /NCGR_PEP_ID=MMETSP1437-20131217/47020_1 /TAXON_ID=49252 ORGANISM="Eucampia antarctica, Strain CCMP1452" /NCGR_SAMPLE_ID=MMETSP1437 /ASSEMBLY_ACC=CAM_ASM_001096 /LENGTH=126 /DNA_ID=CAMNT_0043452877 /DNA_START=524 /DNA_END=901 /DNA_ORIENTATION=-